MDTNKLRKIYLDFFASQGHKIVPSSSLVPADDPTLLFTSAGMNQFKKEFLGGASNFKTAASCQRCLRTDDLDKVGVTAYHHTFFEMLGNFSFGAYFKQEAIEWAWEFLHDKLKLSAKVLWVSVYQEDDEAYNIWKKKIGWPEEKIVKLGPKENFWPANAIEEGPNGPCGPCSEIFFDYGENKECKNPDCKPGCPCGRFVEIWNLVFTQYNRKEGGILEPLPNKNIDTGMGLERMASVLQGVKSNFEIDIFKPIIQAVLSHQPSTINHQLINAIADHIRAITFAIYDGIIPSNTERGYVVRKLIRKAAFHGYTLGIKEPFLYKLAAVVANVFDGVYPELKDKLRDIGDVILSEEKNFGSTLKSAPSILEREFKDNARGMGLFAFKLYDTYGIPFEITQGWLEKKGLKIDIEEFNRCLKEQKERSQKSSVISKGVFSEEALNLKVNKSRFLGYYNTIVKNAKILKIINEGKFIKATKESQYCQLVLDKTPFYPEAGGQIGDRGKILKAKNVFSVEDTVRYGDVIMHLGKVESGKFKVSDLVSCEVKEDFRQAVARAHTATHILQASLRKVLGEHIKQSGSLVSEDRLRFDFIHPEKISPEKLKQIEDLVQENILSGHKIETKLTTFKNAKKLGALAFFGDKYESEVRMVNIGKYSKELCAGTHLANSCEVGLLKIISESSVAKGVRRIEALTGKLAWNKIKDEQDKLGEIISLLKTPSNEIISVLEDRFKKALELEKELERLRFELLKCDIEKLLDEAEDINGVKLITNKYENIEIGLLRKMADLIRTKVSSFAICFAVVKDSRVSILVVLSNDLVKGGLDAAGIVKETALLIDGGGGGRQNIAEAGGSNVGGIEAAFTKFREIIKSERK